VALENFTNPFLIGKVGPWTIRGSSIPISNRAGRPKVAINFIYELKFSDSAIAKRARFRQ
jgi:hypothetical protein